jgi:hypothetical protein
MEEIPQTIPFAPPYFGIHIMTIFENTFVSSKALGQRIESFARNIIRGINDPQDANVYFCGSHAPVRYVHCVWAPVNTDEDSVSKEAAAMLAACSMIPRPASCTCNAPAGDGSCIGGVNPQPGRTKACQLCSARALVERFRQSVVGIMENVKTLLGTSSGCIVAAGAAAASGEGGEGNGAIRFPDFCCGESIDVLRWVKDQSKWVISMYHTFHTMGGLEPMSEVLMLNEELASFVSKMQVHSQFMLLSVLKDMCALRERYDAILADSERDAIVVHAVVRWICKLQVGCLNRRIWYYSPAVHRFGRQHVRKVLSSPSLGSGVRTPADVERVFQEMELPLLDVLRCGFAGCGLACAAEVSRALPRKHLRSGFAPGEEPGMGGRVSATSALRILYRYSNVLFAHGVVAMLFRTGDWHEKFLAERIFPLDRACIGIFRDAIRLAAVSAIVLREGFLAIERFRDEDVLRSSQSSAWAERSADIDECACKAAFMRYVVWSLNDGVFKRSSTELVRACKRDLEAIAGNERAAFLSNLVEHGDALPADERLRVMRTIAVLWSLWISVCIVPRTWIPGSSNAGGSDDGEEGEEDANALYADMQKLLTRDSCMLLTAFRAFCSMHPRQEDMRMPASGDGAPPDAQEDTLRLPLSQARSGLAEPSEQPRSPASGASGSTDVYLDQFAADAESINAQEEDEEGGYATDGIRNNYYEFGVFRSILPSKVNASKSWDLCSNLLRFQEEEWKPVPTPPPPSPSSSSPSFPCASSMYSRIVQTLRGTKPPVRSCAAAEGGTGNAGKPLRGDEGVTAFDKYSKELTILKPFLSYMAVQFGSVLVNNMYYLEDQHADFMRSVVDRCCSGGCDACRSSSSRIAAAWNAHYSESAQPPSGTCTVASGSTDAVKRHRKV